MSSVFCDTKDDIDSTTDNEDLDTAIFDDVSWSEVAEKVDSEYDEMDQTSLFNEVSDQSVKENDEEVPASLVSEETSSDTSEKMEGQVDIDGFIDYKTDLKHTPSDDSDLGEWTGDRGESIFIPRDEEAQRILHELGLEGIPYRGGRPDFSDITVATVYLSQEDMQLKDRKQKEMANFTLAEDLNDAEDGEEDTVETIDPSIVEAVSGRDVADFYNALLAEKMPIDYVWHHGDIDDQTDGQYPYSLISSAIHDACIHRGGRSHSGTKR